jgi:hypothetical protein
MHTQYLLKRATQWLVALAAVWMLGACAFIGSDIVDHSFGFDLAQDNQDAEVLDYWYGSAKSPVRAAPYRLKKGDTFYFQGVTGPMHRPEALYVKWRNRKTGQVYEDTVDLRNRLPRDIARQRVYFMIYGPQLYIYLISNERRPANIPRNGPTTYDSMLTTTIYPDQVK